MFERLEKIGQDLERAKKKRAEWEAKVKELERRYREEENTQIHGMVHAANLTPEQLAELIKLATTGVPKPDVVSGELMGFGTTGGKGSENEIMDNETEDKNDEEYE